MILDESQEAILTALSLIVDAARQAMEEGRAVELDSRASTVECEPQNNHVTRKATGEKMFQIFIGPKRWSPDVTG